MPVLARRRSEERTTEDASDGGKHGAHDVF